MRIVCSFFVFTFSSHFFYCGVAKRRRGRLCHKLGEMVEPGRFFIWPGPMRSYGGRDGPFQALSVVV